MAKLLSWRRRKYYTKCVALICIIFFFIFFTFSMVVQVIDHLSKIYQTNEPIDVVYTWVNGSDPRFLKDLRNFLISNNIQHEDKYLHQRFDDKEELRFSLRSLEKYAPWINHVYIVTNGQIPYWLNLNCRKVTIITHEDIFLDHKDLPTFSSPAIESHIHRIHGLSKRFLYFNDDIFLGQPVHLTDFHTPNNEYMLYFSYSIGQCAPQCFWVYVADNQCDEACNNFHCQYDGGDCDSQNTSENDDFANNFGVHLINRKLRSINEIKKLHGMKNYSSVVEEFNLEFIENEKIKRRRFKKRQRKMGVMKTVRRNPTDVNTSNKTSCAYSASLQHSNSSSQPNWKGFTRLAMKGYVSDMWRTFTLIGNRFLSPLVKQIAFTQRLFNYKYGFMPRLVPSHTPILVNKDIINSLQKKFYKEVIVTSRNRFRSADDLQFAFAYYYFIYHEKNPFDISEVFDTFDTDQTGTWSDREIRTIMTRIYTLPLSYATVDHFETILLNCSKKKIYKTVETPEDERYLDSRLPSITKELVCECTELIEILYARFGDKRKYKHQILKNFGNLHFKQLSSNLTEVVGHLDEIRSEPRKFICLNDNLDYTKGSENELIKSIVYDFYYSLFPLPSKFELPLNRTNAFKHIDELRDWQSGNLFLMFLFIVIVLYVVFLISNDAFLKM